MIPRGIGFFIVILLIDMIFGKITDKSKDYQNTTSQSKYEKDFSKDTLGKGKATKANVKKEKVSKPKKEEVVNFTETDDYLTQRDDYFIETDNYFVESGYSEIGDMIEKTEKENKRKYNQKKIKKDLLKGIIFSEILSQPKSIQNRGKSI